MTGKRSQNTEIWLLRLIVVVLLIVLASLGYYIVNSKPCVCELSMIHPTNVHLDIISTQQLLVETFPEASTEINLLPDVIFKEQLCTFNLKRDKACDIVINHSVYIDTLMGEYIIPKHYHPPDITTVTTVDQICQGYNLIFEKGALFSYTNFLGVPLQQDPNDAFAIMDLIWRLKPDLMIELGTAGGGSAFFYAFIMTAYNKDAKVITIDPKRTFDWNQRNVKRVCPHCTYARDTKLWNSTTINFFNDIPVNVVPMVENLIKKWGSKNVLVMEDGNHLTKTVHENINAYAKFVTPGSYLIVQDTKMKRLYHRKDIDPAAAVDIFLSSPGIGQQFAIDRTFEYYLCGQHAKGFLKRKSSDRK